MRLAYFIKIEKQRWRFVVSFMLPFTDAMLLNFLLCSDIPKEKQCNYCQNTFMHQEDLKSNCKHFVTV